MEETAQLRKVKLDKFKVVKWELFKVMVSIQIQFIKLIIVFKDVDECADGTHDCDANTVCVDTLGSYRCGKEFRNDLFYQDKVESL